jgi:hypothetical protein
MMSDSHSLAATLYKLMVMSTEEGLDLMLDSLMILDVDKFLLEVCSIPRLIVTGRNNILRLIAKDFGSSRLETCWFTKCQVFLRAVQIGGQRLFGIESAF